MKITITKKMKFNNNNNNKDKKTPKKQTKYQGIILHEHLTFKMHIASVKQKITQATGLLAKLRHYVSLRIL